MKVVSLFDGAACGYAALERKGIHVECYYASEIDKHAMFIAKKNWPKIVHIGDVRQVRVSALPFIPDLVIGGSPCQGFSFAGKRLNLDDPRSKLFWEYHRIVKEAHTVNPDVKFMLENVLMDAKSEWVISQAMGEIFGFKAIIPLLINSALVSAQNRERLYWTNIGPWDEDQPMYRRSKIPQPEDRGIVLKDIIEDGAVDRGKSYCLDANYAKGSGGGKTTT